MNGLDLWGFIKLLLNCVFELTSIALKKFLSIKRSTVRKTLDRNAFRISCSDQYIPLSMENVETLSTRKLITKTFQTFCFEILWRALKTTEIYHCEHPGLSSLNLLRSTEFNIEPRHVRIQSVYGLARVLSPPFRLIPYGVRMLSVASEKTRKTLYGRHTVRMRSESVYGLLALDLWLLPLGHFATVFIRWRVQWQESRVPGREMRDFPVKKWDCNGKKCENSGNQ